MNSCPRRVLGGRTPDEVDRLGRVPYSAAGRKELADEVRAAQKEAVRDARERACSMPGVPALAPRSAGATRMGLIHAGRISPRGRNGAGVS
jgi:hypothetical protein